MDDRPDELFLIDIDQEAKQLAQYGAGAADLSAERLASSLHYLSSLLVSIGFHPYASFASCFAQSTKRMEEGEARRSARDFAEILRQRIDAVRSDDQDQSSPEIPESLWERLPEQTGLASMMSRASRGGVDAPQFEQQDSDGFETVEATSEHSEPDRAPAIVESTVFDEAGVSSNSAPLVTTVQVDECFRRAVRLAEGDIPVWPPGMQALFDSIDELDRVGLAQSLPASIQWAAGAEAMISRPLADGLAKALPQALNAPVLELVADAMVVAHTLIISIRCAEPMLSIPIARFASSFSGRMEVSDHYRRMRLTLPASKRLLRVVPLRLGEDWFAVPWAQFVGAGEHDSVDIKSVAVSLGNTPDRIRADEIGLVTVGVWYELPKPLRHRDRYRGVVLISRGNALPVFG